MISYNVWYNFIYPIWYHMFRYHILLSEYWNHKMISLHDIMLWFNSLYPIRCQDYDFMLWCQNSALDVMLWYQFWIHEIINMKPIFARAGPVRLRFSGGSSSLQHGDFTPNKPLLPFLGFLNIYPHFSSQRGAARSGSGTHFREQAVPAPNRILEKFLVKNGVEGVERGQSRFHVLFRKSLGALVTAAAKMISCYEICVWFATNASVRT